jgi:hypothetical protein
VLLCVAQNLEQHTAGITVQHNIEV